MQLPPTTVAVEYLLLFGSLVGVIGEPGLGKSMALVDLVVAMASGTPWLGRRTAGAIRVLVVPAEGRLRSWLERLQAAAKLRGLDLAQLPIAVHTHDQGGSPYVRGLDLTAGDKLNLLSAVMGCQPGLVVFDPFVDLFSGDENSVRDVRLLLNVLRTLAAQTNALVVFAHHSRKPPPGTDEERPSSAHDIRGSSAIRGALDTVIQLSRIGASAVDVAVTKQRDLPTPTDAIAAFEIRDLGFGPVVQLVDGSQLRAETKARRTAKKTAERMHEESTAVLAALAAAGGVSVLSKLVASAGIKQTAARTAVERLESAQQVYLFESQSLDSQGRPHPCTYVSTTPPAVNGTAGPASPLGVQQ